MSLSADDFAAFFREINDGYDPFPWQSSLAGKVMREGWPDCLDIPTGAGKTAVLEIAVFHLAVEAQSENWTARKAPVRIVMVVDRRLIVDQAQKRAARIVCCLNKKIGPICAKVAAALCRLAGGDEPLIVRSLRGGVPREDDWARTPSQPTVLLSTVDQVGSRLLFRGYGVSKSMRPVHAGLLGSDCLVFLDEAHLSEPFRQTLRWVAQYRNTPWCERNPAPWHFVQLSATPTKQSSSVDESFCLDSGDHSHPLLGARIQASKPAELRETMSEDDARAYAELAVGASQQPDVRRVLVVVNRVKLARQIFELLPRGESLLLTGRVRELDRERIAARLEEVFVRGERVIAVATQCIEAGADYDFDALITQLAPLDALRQRFGRLNRKGRAIAAQAFVVASKEDRSSRRLDPVYGDRSQATWKMLEKIAVKDGKRRVVDFGIAALGQTIAIEDLAEVNTKKADAPIMPAAYIDLWSCTNPEPAVAPEVALFLHGVESPSAEVQIVWRADITRDDFENPAWIRELLSVVPPRTGEMMSVPLWSVRSWLAEKPAAANVTDTEADSGPEERQLSGRPIYRWCGSDDPDTRVVWPYEIHGGDVLVAPAAYGGCDEWGWNTGSPTALPNDCGLEAAARLRTSEIAIRLHPDVLREEWESVRPKVEEFWEDPTRLLEVLIDLLPNETENAFASELRSVRAGTETAFLYKDGRPELGAILCGRRAGRVRTMAAPSTEVDITSAEGHHALLSVHTEGVVLKARDFAIRVGLDEKLQYTLAFAARFHDAGKADLRFQRLLGNSKLGFQLLAKSQELRAPTANRLEIGLPEQWRHEALSVRIAMLDEGFSTLEIDQELALWLIGTHHGWGRPFFPHDDELDDMDRVLAGADGNVLRLPTAPGPQRIDFEWGGRDWVQLFDLLLKRYGPWELARLESIIRLADHRASEEGQNADAHSARAGA